MAYIVDKNNEVKFTIDWKWLYGELPSGSYRTLKQVNDKLDKLREENKSN